MARRNQLVVSSAVPAFAAVLVFGSYRMWERLSAAQEQRLPVESSSSVESRTVASNWPGLFGPSNNSQSGEDAQNLRLDWPEEGPPVKWRRPAGQGYSSPIVYGGNLILFYREGNEEILECLNAETELSQWTFRGPTNFQDRYHYSSGPYSTPVTDGERVYAVGAEGRFYCVELGTGNPVWSRFLTQDYGVPRGMFAVGASPLLEGDVLIFNLGAAESNAGIIALDKMSGKTVWTATDHGAGMATPRAADIHGTRHVFVLTLEGLVCLAPRTGEVRWIETFHANNPEKINATSPLISEDLVLLSAESKGSLCLRILRDGNRDTAWETRRDLQSQYSTVIGIDGFAYAFHAGNKTFRCLNLADGKLQWQWPASGEIGIGRGSAIAVGNRLILFGEYGNLAALEINSHKPLLKSLTSQPLLSRDCFSSPAFANGLLYLRNEKEIVCFDLKAEDHPSLKAGVR